MLAAPLLPKQTDLGDHIQYVVPWVERSQPPNGISISSTVFAGIMNLTNRQTDRRTDHATPSVTISRILCNECEAA